MSTPPPTLSTAGDAINASVGAGSSTAAPSSSSYQGPRRGRGRGASAGAGAGVTSGTPRSSTASSRGSDSTNNSHRGAHHQQHHFSQRDGGYSRRNGGGPRNGGPSAPASPFYQQQHQYGRGRGGGYADPASGADDNSSSAATTPLAPSPITGGLRGFGNGGVAAAAAAAAAAQLGPCYNLRIKTRSDDVWVADYRNRPVQADSAGNLYNFLNGVSPSVALKDPLKVDADLQQAISSSAAATAASSGVAGAGAVDATTASSGMLSASASPSPTSSSVGNGSNNNAAASAHGSGGVPYLHERFYFIFEMMAAFRQPFGVPIALQSPGVRLAETSRTPESELYYTPQLSGFHFEYRRDDEILRQRLLRELEDAKREDGYCSSSSSCSSSGSCSNSGEDDDDKDASNVQNRPQPRRSRRESQTSEATSHSAATAAVAAAASSMSASARAAAASPKPKPYTFQRVLSWHETAKPELRGPLHHQFESLVRQPDRKYRMLLKARNTDFTVTSWFAVYWVPIHVKSHTPQNSAGSFLCFYLVNPPANMPGSSFQRMDSNCFYFRGDYISTAPVSLWDAAPSKRGLEAFAPTPSAASSSSRNKQEAAAAAAAAATAAAAAATTSSANESSSPTPGMAAAGSSGIGAAGAAGEETVTATSSSVTTIGASSAMGGSTTTTATTATAATNVPAFEHDNVHRMRVPIVGVLPARAAPDVWFRKYTYPMPGGGVYTAYAAPLFLIAAAIQLVQHAKTTEMRRMLDAGAPMSEVALAATVLPDFDHLLRLEAHLAEFAHDYTV